MGWRDLHEFTEQVPRNRDSNSTAKAPLNSIISFRRWMRMLHAASEEAFTRCPHYVLNADKIYLQITIMTVTLTGELF